MDSREPLPRFVAPLLARSGPLPKGAGWALELEFDGMRAQFRIDGRSVWVRSRTGRDCSAEFPELAGIATALRHKCTLLKGELVCLDPRAGPTSGACGRACARRDTRHG